jgi:hypothetical protein
MRPPALFPLFARPKGLAVAAMGAIIVLVPLTTAFTVVPLGIVSGLPITVEGAATQSLVLGLLLVGSQALHWHALTRHFERRDLGGESASLADPVDETDRHARFPEGWPP